jgi:serine/threonine protein phosphatase PrpC
MLLCSDGFWQQVDAEEIRAVVASTRHPGDALDGLVATARARGGNGGDNISALLATRQAPRLWATWRRLTGGR